MADGLLCQGRGPDPTGFLPVSSPAPGISLGDLNEKGLVSKQEAFRVNLKKKKSHREDWESDHYTSMVQSTLVPATHDACPAESVHKDTRPNRLYSLALSG